jgi:hypothetical protein
MGGLFSNARAENEANTIINSGISVANDTLQKCGVQLNNINQDDIVVSGNSNTVDISEIEQDQSVILDSSCVANNTASTTLSQDVTNAMQQAAAAIVGSLSLGSSDANNIINNTYNLSEQLTNSFVQKCSPQVNNDNSVQFTIKGNTNKLYIGYIDQNQLANVVTSCLQQSVIQNQAAQNIQQTIAQSATAKNEGLLDALKWVLIILAIVGGIILLVIVIVFISGAFHSGGSSGSGSSTAEVAAAAAMV